MSGLGILAFFQGLLFQNWVLGLSFLLIALLFYYIANFFFFIRWLLQDVSTPPPNLLGGWYPLALHLYRHAKTQQRKLKKSMEHADLYHAALMAQPEGLIGLSEDFKIQWLNPSSEKLLGLKVWDKGKPIEAFIRTPEFIHYLKERSFNRSLQTYASIDSHRILDIQLAAYRQGHYLLVVRDITEMYRIAEVRKDFVANASHELRTPLTVLAGYLELMVDAVEVDLSLQGWQQPIDEMQAQSERMRQIIEDLLTLSALETEGVSQSYETVHVPELLHQLEKEVRQLSGGRHQIQFLIESPTCGLRAHAHLVRSVLINLLSNAVRYTPEGGRITAVWRCSEAGAVFSVKDTGVGIPREAIPRITERFYRVDTARSRESGGTGLGLSIVKHILEKYEAELKVESIYRMGSTFTVIFPEQQRVQLDAEGT
ncbi:phosphate regulon sensor histidine kinase PhoR [Galenea microaerophila]